jgi:AcrR family transcriptional regulator
MIIRMESEGSAVRAVDRRTAIADAAIEILASEGSRGLTHRAVDRWLGIVEGSTSSYYRTRNLLIEAAAKRISELDLQAVIAALSPPPTSLEAAAKTFAQLVADTTLPENRPRHRARYALIVEAAGHPDVPGTFSRVTGPVIDVTAPLLGEMGEKDPGLAAASLAIYMNSLIMALVTEDDGHPIVPIDQLEALLYRHLRGFAG